MSLRILLIPLIGALLSVACDKRAQDAPNGPATSSPAIEERRAPVLDPAPPWKFPAAKRLVALGDVHGDIEGARRALRLAGATDASGKWTGGELVVVQTGDQLDRGDDELEILNWFDRLKNEAREAGGAFIVLNGNHEIMNVAGDFRYVTPAGFLSFSRVRRDAVDDDRLRRFVERARGRAAAFLPGGTYAVRLADHLMVAKVGTTVFVHGGVAPPHIRYGIDRIHSEVQSWMRGKLDQPSSMAVGAQGPIWLRAYSLPTVDAAGCAMLERTLDALDAERMVVGHTVQERGITSACDKQVWRIDVGLASYYGDNPAQVLEIKEDERVKILKVN